MKTQLFENEKIITESEGETIILTNRRICQSTSTYGKSHTISIHLEKISSIESSYQSSPNTLIAGIIGMGAGVLYTLKGQESTGVASFFVGIILLAAYLITRRHTIRITSDGGTSIKFNTEGMNNEKILAFINQVEQAKGELKN